MDQGYNDIEYFQQNSAAPAANSPTGNAPALNTAWRKTPTQTGIVRNIPIAIAGNGNGHSNDDRNSPFAVQLTGAGTVSSSPTILQRYAMFENFYFGNISFFF